MATPPPPQYASRPPSMAKTKKYDPKKPHITEEPITKANWYKHVNWLNITLIIGVPIYGMIAAYWTPLQWKTAVWAFAYYVMTGLGITAGTIRTRAISNPSANTLQVTIDSGLTPHTLPQPLSRSSSPPLEEVPSKARFDGGREITVLTTDIPIPTRTHTPFERASYTRISDG